jgi:hypothetical protein
MGSSTKVTAPSTSSAEPSTPSASSVRGIAVPGIGGKKLEVAKRTPTPQEQRVIDQNTEKIKKEAPLWNDPNWVAQKNLLDQMKIQSAKENAKNKQITEEFKPKQRNKATKAQEDAAGRVPLLGGPSSFQGFQRKTLLGQ